MARPKARLSSTGLALKSVRLSSTVSGLARVFPVRGETPSLQRIQAFLVSEMALAAPTPGTGALSSLLLLS